MAKILYRFYDTMVVKSLSGSFPAFLQVRGEDQTIDTCDSAGASRRGHVAPLHHCAGTVQGRWKVTDIPEFVRWSCGCKSL